MADASAPFVITTQLDLTGINVGLKKLQGVLASFKGTGLQKPINLIDTKQLAAAAGQIDNIIVKTKIMQAGMAGAASNADKFAKSTKRAGNAMADVASRVFVWGAMSAAIFGALSNLKEMYTFTVNLNTAMAELQKVMPKESDFVGLQTEAFDLSIKFGQAPEEVLQVLKRFAQAGLDSKEAIVATETALIAMNATGASTEESINAIIGANKIFGITWENTATVIDKVMRLQANFAVDSKDLIASITAIGPAVTVLNGNIDDLFSNIAALGEAARISGKEASNSLKRVFSRIASKEGVKTLEDLNVAVYSSVGNFRPLRDILGDVSDKLEGASLATKKNVAESLAQVRQYSKFIALLNNYDRAQEALIQSETAKGEAFAASQISLETYAKQLEIAGAKTKQFFAGFFGAENLGAVDVFTSIKVGLGEFVQEFLTPVAGKLGTFTTVLVGAGVAATAVVFILRTFAAATAAGVSKIQLFTGAVLRKTTALNVDQAAMIKNISVTKMLSATLGLVSIAIAGALYAYGKYAEKQEKVNRRVEESRKELRKYVDTLEEVNFASDNVVTVEDKFKTLRGALKDLNTDSASAKEIANTFSQILYGKPGEKLTKEEMGDLSKVVSDFVGTVTNVTFAPFNTAVEEALNKARKSAFEFTRDFNLDEIFSTSLGTALPKIDVVGDVESPKLPAGFADAYEQDISKLAKKLRTVVSSFGGKGFTEEFFGSDYREGSKKAAKSLLETIDLVKDYEQQISKLKATLDTTEGTEFFDTKNIETLEKINDLMDKSSGAIDTTADALFSLIDTEKLFASYADEVARAEGEAQIGMSDFATEVEVVQLVFDRLLQKFKEGGADRVAFLADMANIKEGIKEFYRALKEGEDSSLFTIDLNTAAYLSAFKETNAAVLSGIGAQLTAFAQLEGIGLDLGSTFDVSKEAIRGVEGGIKKLISTISDGENKLNELKLQINAIEELRRVIVDINNKSIVLIDPKATTDLDSQQKKLVVAQTQLQNIQGVNNKQLESQLGILLTVRSVLEDMEEKEKGINVYLSAQNRVREAVLKTQLEFNKITTRDASTRLAKEEKIYKEILKVQLETLNVEKEKKIITANKAAEKEAELKVAYEVARIERGLSDTLSQIEGSYGRINTQASAVSDAIKVALTDEEAFFKNLEESSSVWKIMERGFKGIAGAIRQADADILGGVVTDSIGKSMEKADAELNALKDQFTHQVASALEVGTAIAAKSSMQTAIVEGGVKAASLIFNSMVDGAQYMEEVLRLIPKFLQGNVKEIRDVPTTTELRSGVVKSEPTGGQDFDKAQFENAINDEVSKRAGTNVASNAATAEAISAAIVESTASTLAKYKQQVDERNLIAERDLLEATKETVRLLEEIKQNGDNTLTADQAKVESAKDRSKIDAAFRFFGGKISQAIGFSIAKDGGRDASGVIAGSNIGAVLGKFIVPGGDPLGLGGIVGGIFGGFFGKEKEEEQIEQLIQINKNTAQLVDRLSPEIWHAPAGFSIPVGTGFGGGGGNSSIVITNNINASGGGALSTSDIDVLTEQLNDIYRRTPAGV